VGGTPEFLFEPRDEGEACEVVRRCNRQGVPLRVLGGGFNLLVRDGRLPGAVLLTHRLQDLRVLPDRIEAGAGVSFPSLVKRAILWQVPGLPGCPGIPGNVGGVVAMNAGGRFGSVADALSGIRYVSPSGELVTRDVNADDLGYRCNHFGAAVITGASFRRDPSLPAAELRALHAEALQWKRETQPLGTRSAGCIFKNPVDASGQRSAGRLIDEAGCKGLEIGGARVSPVHANFIEAGADATSDDIEALIERIRDAVRARFGVELELEVQTW
jgi:UDP-N-acetylmuramate dehydrogenase